LCILLRIENRDGIVLIAVQPNASFACNGSRIERATAFGGSMGVFFQFVSVGGFVLSYPALGNLSSDGFQNLIERRAALVSESLVARG
jgi:hypothetical protein